MTENEIVTRYTKMMEGTEIERILVLAQLTGHRAARIYSILSEHGVDVQPDVSKLPGRLTWMQRIVLYDMLDSGLSRARCARALGVPLGAVGSFAERFAA